MENKLCTLEHSLPTYAVGYTATPSKLNKANVVIPLTQYNNLKKTAIEGAQNTHGNKKICVIGKRHLMAESKR